MTQDESDGGRLVAGMFVQVAGTGPTVVLLHGNGEDSASLAPVAADLARDHRVLSVDSRGHGRSPRGDGPLTIARMSDDVAAVLAATGDAPAHVVGYSDGGNVALMLALRHPGSVRSLVLYGANTDPGGLTPRTRADVTLAWARQRAGAAVSPERRLRAEITDLMVRQPRIPLRALGRIAVPVLVLAGEHDVVRREHTEAIAAHLPAGSLEVIEGADHGLPVSDPGALVSRVRAFLPA